MESISYEVKDAPSSPSLDVKSQYSPSPPNGKKDSPRAKINGNVGPTKSDFDEELEKMWSMTPKEALAVVARYVEEAEVAIAKAEEAVREAEEAKRHAEALEIYARAARRALRGMRLRRIRVWRLMTHRR